jgi:hypothetical protein
MLTIGPEIARGLPLLTLQASDCPSARLIHDPGEDHSLANVVPKRAAQKIALEIDHEVFGEPRIARQPHE